ncbi:MAG: HAMP domain-containing histidine kinase [bacterium]|nr:HAMP domain-containing histidine kinase [bacterium]
MFFRAKQEVYDDLSNPDSPENKEILATWRIALAVGLLGTVAGLPSDLENIPEQYHAVAYAVRGTHLVCIVALLLIAWMRPLIVLRNHSSIAVIIIGSVYVYLTWLDATSGNITGSGYHRSLIMPSIALMVFRRMRLWIQTGALVFAVVYYGVVISYTYDLSLFGESEAERKFQDILMDLTQIHLILLLVFRRYRTYQYEELRLRDLLNRANDAKSEVIAKVNHELHVPLLGILANLDSLEQKIGDTNETARARRIIDRTHNYCVYQKTLIHNMIYASAAEGHDPFFIDREDSAGLRECYGRSTDLVRDIHDGEIHTEELPDVFVACQNEILMIVLVNILSNCAEHSSNVRVSWGTEGGLVEMKTENDLVTPLDLDGIFDKWTTTRQDKTKPILGLGLNIARDLIQKIGGDIQVRQDGQVFYLNMRLPILA